MSISGRAVQVSNMRLHGYDLEGFSQGCESFQQLHRKGRGKLGLARPLGEQMDLQVRTIRPGCVAEIHRVDLAHSIAPGTAGELWKASDAHAVLSSGTKACLTTYRAAGEERDDGAVGGVMPLSRDSQLANLPSAGHRACARVQPLGAKGHDEGHNW